MKLLLISCSQTSPWASNFILSFLVQRQYWFFGSQLSLNCQICVFNTFAYTDSTEKGRVLQFYFALCCLILSSNSDAADNKMGYQHFLSHVILFSEHCVQFIFISVYILLMAERVSVPSCPFACLSLYCFLSAQHAENVVFLFSPLS